MKTCPKCQQSYEAWIEFCFNDGSPLQTTAPPPAPMANDPFDVPEPRFVSGTDLPEPGHLRPALTPTPSAGEATLPRYTRPLRNTPQVVVPAPTAPVQVEPFAAVPRPPVAPPNEAPAEASLGDLGPTQPVNIPPTVAEAALDDDVFGGAWDARAGAPAAAPVAARAPKPPTAPAPTSAGGGTGSKVALAVIALCILGGGAAAYNLLGSDTKGDVAPAQQVVEEAPLAIAATPPVPAEVPAEIPPPAPPEEPPAPTPVVEAAAAPVAPAPPSAAPAPREETPRPAAAPARPPPAPGRTEPAVPAVRPQATAAQRPSNTVSDSPWGVEAAPTVGTLRVRSEPAGAKVFIDNSERGRTPLDVELPYGSHNVRVAQRGYKPEVRDVSIRVRELTVPFTLRPELTTGQVTVYAPDAARIAVDGNDVGVAPVSISLSEGMHNFRLSAGEKTCTVAKEVKFGGGTSTKLTLACP